LCVDIGSSSVKLLEVEGDGSSLRVDSFAVAPLPPSAVQNNLVQEPETVGAAIGECLRRTKMRARSAITAVPGPAVIIKKMHLPTQTAGDLEQAVLFEAGNFIPESLENVSLDYMVTDVLEKENQYEILLVAVKKEILESYVTAVRKAGLEPVIVDVDYFALENMFELNYAPQEHSIVALVNVGARYSCMNILRGNRSTFTGDVPVGGKEFNDALVRNLGVDPAEAEAIKLGKDLEYPPEAIEPILQPVKEFLVEEIHRALSFFWTASTDESISRIYLSGGTAGVPGLAELLGERLEVPVERVDPFARVELGRGVDRPALERQASAFAVAVGLGVRRPGDK
jgi:type IV pilus assembly protein PilM